MRRTQISPGRKFLYYLGWACIATGGVVMLTTIFRLLASTASHEHLKIGDPEFGRKFDAQVEENHENRSMVIKRIFPMGLLIGTGFFLVSVGFAGKAGSGLVLDPEQARKDMEPWSRMQGGMLNDALSEVDVLQDIKDGLKGKTEVKIRCYSCRAVNDENAKFCSQCGKAV